LATFVVTYINSQDEERSSSNDTHCGKMTILFGL